MACQIPDIIFLDLGFEFLGLVFVAWVLGFGSLLFSSPDRARQTRGRQGGLPTPTTRLDRSYTPTGHRPKIALVFDLVFHRFLVDLGLQNGTQNRSTISLRGILGSFWLQFGPSGGSCSSFFGVHVCFFWLAACLLLVLFFSCVLSSAARLLSYQATRHRSPKR